MTSNLNACLLAVTVQDELDTIDGEPFAALRNKNRPIISDRAVGEPIVERGICWRREVDHALPASLALNFQTRWLVEKYIVEGKVADFTHPQPAFEHEGEHGFVAFVVDNGEEEFDLFLASVTWERMRLAEEMSLRDDGALDGLFIDDREEIIKQPQGGKPAVDGEGRKSLCETVLDICIHVMWGNIRGRFPCP
jgi:hypothetical protein